MNSTPDTTAAALERIKQLDRDFPLGTGAAPPVDMTRHHVMRGVLETLSQADVAILGEHLTRPTPGPVNTALRSSRWLRTVVNCVAVDVQRETSKGDTH